MRAFVAAVNSKRYLLLALAAALSVLLAVMRAFIPAPEPPLTTTTYTSVTGAVTTQTTVSSRGRSAVITVTGTPEQERTFAALPSPPAGATTWEQARGDRGILASDQFAVAFYNADVKAKAQADEEKRGLRYAVRIFWETRDGHYVDALVIRYANADGARAFCVEHAAKAPSGFDPASLTAIPGIPDGTVYAKAGLTAKGNREAEGYALVGNSVIYVATLTPGGPAGDEAAVESATSALVLGIRNSLS